MQIAGTLVAQVTSSMVNMNVNMLNGAVRECLQRCYASPDWLTSLADFGERLRTDGWPEGDIEEVERTVQHILAAVKDGKSKTS